MPDKHYPWKRFWVPRGSTISLEDRGFLLDPERVPAYFGEAVPFEKIAAYPCLVLLGEPGIGKSRAMEAEWEAHQKAVEPAGAAPPYFNLKEYASEDRLVRDLFESKEFTAWQQGTNTLHLFLDSLDEGQLHIAPIAALLTGYFKRLSVEQVQRLKLRIACRTAEWPSQLEDGLPDLWGKDNVGLFVLAPLRRKDVQVAARMSGIANQDAFLEEIEQRDAQPLAVKPVTLELLLKIYSQGGRLPARQTELYLEGMERLATEMSSSRRDAKKRGALRPKQRLAAAARVAAVLVFCRRSAVYSGSNVDEVQPDDVSIEDLSGGTESVGGDPFPVGDAEIREVPNTGLFSSLGPDRLAFSHQTYAEFLAATYLTDHGLETTQILSLIRHQRAPDGTVVPQLAETAAWLALLHVGSLRGSLKRCPVFRT